MTFHTDQWGNEVDEQGYLRQAVEGWAQHGIYPPPLVGDPRNSEIVARVKESRARWEALSEDDRILHRRRVAEFIEQWDRDHPELAAAMRATEASKTS